MDARKQEFVHEEKPNMGSILSRRFQRVRDAKAASLDLKNGDFGRNVF
jgi:hypothetical protein